MKKLFIMLMILLFAVPCWGATNYFYVKSSGSKVSGSSTEGVYTDANCYGDPDLSILFASENLGDGDDDIIEYIADIPGGSQTFTIATSFAPGFGDYGTSGHNVIVQGRSGDTITIDANSNNIHAFSCYQASYITVQNLTIIGADQANRAGVSVSQSNNILVNNCIITGNQRGVAFTTADPYDVYNITITGCTIHTNIETGVWWNT